MIFSRKLFSAAAAAAAVFLVSVASAQQGPLVKEIAVEYVGPPSITRDRVLANLATQVGQPYSERGAEEDIRALYSTGGVANVRIFAEPLGDGVK